MANREIVQAIGEALNEGSVRRASKKKVTITDKVFAVLSTAYNDNKRLTIRDIADQINHNSRAVQASICTLRKLGFTINCKYRERDTEGKEAFIYEYWFPQEGEAETNMRSQRDEEMETVEQRGAALALIADELQFATETVEILRNQLDENEKANRETVAALTKENELLKTAAVSKLIAYLKDDVLVEMAVDIAPLMGQTFSQDFRGKMYKMLKERHAKQTR